MVELARRLSGYRLWIFDADDTLRRTTVPGQPCPRRAGEWELLPGVRETLADVAWNGPGGPWLGLATNQDQVGAGLVSLETAKTLLHALALAAARVRLPEAAIQLCPHALGIACECRKPQPAMLRRIMRHYGLGPADTAFVGNHPSDRQAAAAAGAAYVEASLLFRQPQST